MPVINGSGHIKHNGNVLNLNPYLLIVNFFLIKVKLVNTIDYT